MSREIKFRAWNKTIKVMYSSDNQNDQQGQLHTLEQFFNAMQVRKKEKNYDIELMQFTGLQDKKGKDIYEGDTMHIQLPMGGFWGNVKQEKTGTVKYESDYGGYIVEWEYSKNQHHVLLNCDIAFEGEIVGNIYENS
jgi:uncharacterized phage protein (TIGR01671 family)